MKPINNLIPSAISAQSSDADKYANETLEERQQRLCNLSCDLYNSSTGNLNEADGYDCPECKNRGGFLKPKKIGNFWYEIQAPCKCDNIRKAIRRLNKSGLKNIVKDYTFDKFKATESWQQALKKAALDYCENGSGKWFYIGGQTGSGKTHLCTAIAVKLIKQGKSTKYLLWREDVVKLKANVNEAETYNKMMQEYKTAEVLYIDDLFKTGKGSDGKPQQPTVADINIAFEIINHRYNNKNLYTVISSESSISQLLAIDEATGGRIAEMSVQQGYGFSIKPDVKKNYRLKNIQEL